MLANVPDKLKIRYKLVQNNKKYLDKIIPLISRPSFTTDEVVAELERYVIPPITLEEGEVFVMSVEMRGDGSNNTMDMYLPAISLYTTVKLLRKAIKSFLRDHRIDAGRDLLNRYILLGGLIIDEFQWLRIYKLRLDREYDREACKTPEPEKDWDYV